VGSQHSADHTAAVPLQLYRGCTVRQGQDNRVLLHKAPQFLLSSLAPLYTNVYELHYQLAHTVLLTPDALTIYPLGLCTGPNAAARPQHCCTYKLPSHKTECNRTPIPTLSLN